ncbi:semaphorin-1A-like isoform X3 [Bacillus rossius redtenbacheri]|uniref:semaphorin-1A-like isoform X3 n=1 Tax=Bacillus rossius redtenbacheri TaxID=93214 RepID=UPI002FDE76F6
MSRPHHAPRPVALLAACLSLCLPLVAAWVHDVQPKMYFQLGELTPQRFLGNESHKDHFKLLEKDHSSLLVGARNIVYNISLRDLTEFIDQRIEWHSSGPHRDMCYLKGKSEDDCQNYIRVLAKIADGKLLICGTNAYKPLCRHYHHSNGDYIVDKEYEGRGLCPFDPDHNSTGVYSDGQLYSATVADFSGTDPLIYREPLRTERSDLKQLNAPNFVSSMEYDDFIFFFFRETAVEYINCGKMVYSRVARVCKHDKGGPHQFGDRWTSFLKSRLNCSVPGDYPFYFNEIQSTSEIVHGRYGQQAEEMIYGVFTTPVNSIGGSAVCAFSLRSILGSFEGPFKEQETMNANWLAVPTLKVPEPRPGQCVNDSRTLPDVSVNFVKSHTLMDEAVPPYFSRPLIIRISLQYRFTKIAVDPQVRTPDGKAFDVLFIGTDDGKVIKTLNAAACDGNGTVRGAVLEELQVLPPGVPVTNLQVVRPAGDEGKLVVVSDDEVLGVPLHRCDSDKITSCRECVALQDPYCAWDTTLQRCVGVGYPDGAPGAARLVQSVARGEHPACGQHKKEEKPPAPDVSKHQSNKDLEAAVTCPPCACASPGTDGRAPDTAGGPGPASPHRPAGEYDSEIFNNQIVIELDESNKIPNSLAEINQPGPKLPSSQQKLPIYTAETLSIAVATSCLAALAVGFVSGFLFSRRCRGDQYNQMAFNDQHHQLNRLTEGGLNVDAAYLPPCANNKAAINLVLNVPPKNANGKNANSSAENKPIQKVKKTYI